MKEHHRKQAEIILSGLERQNFADFYGKVEEDDCSPFTKYLEGIEGTPSKEDILDTIVRVFRLDWEDGGM